MPRLAMYAYSIPLYTHWRKQMTQLFQCAGGRRERLEWAPFWCSTGTFIVIKTTVPPPPPPIFCVWYVWAGVDLQKWRQLEEEAKG